MQKISTHKTVKKTAIFGGKFDPPHIGHQMLIFLLLEKFNMDEVWIEPAFSHAFGYKSSDFSIRLKMAELLLSPWKNQNRVFVRDDEAKLNKTPVYTIDLLRFLVNEFPERKFFLAIGEDNFNKRDKWKDFDLIEKLCEIIVVGRGNNFEKYISLPNISSTFIKESLKQKKDISYLLPSKVCEFIRKNKLYI